MESRQITRNDGTRQTVTAALVPDARLKIQTVTQLTGMSPSTIRRKVAAGDFPQPVRYGQRCTRWIAGQVTEWLRKDQRAW